MKLRNLGKTKITPIGLGAWQFSGGKGFAGRFWKNLSQKQEDDIIKAALKGGINWFDTAELYGKGNSEMALAHGLKQAGKKNGQVIIATKWNPFGRRASKITKTIEKRINFLAPYEIDLYQIHFPASISSIKVQMDAMADLVDAGKIKAIGVSNFSASQMQKAHEYLKERGLFLASNQVKYNALARSIETNGTLKTAKKLGITIIAYSPLESGLLTGKFHKNPDMLNSRPIIRRMQLKREIEKSRPLINVMEEIAKKHKVSVSQVALNWVINNHGETVVAIPGASKAKHAQESANAMKFKLTKKEMQEISNA